jgi:bifunctional non-homologous end joining protein LigD
MSASARRKTASPARRRAKRATALPGGAVPAPLPARFQPQLATLVDAAPPRPEDWIFEIKFDGYRMLARCDARGIRLFTRNGHDWTHKLPHLARALARLKLPPCWLDGEIVVPTSSGGTSFQQLQNAFDSDRTAGIVFYLFDVPYFAGHDLRAVPLAARRAFLEPLLAKAPAPLRFSAAFDAAPAELVASACKLGLEGIIGKRKDGAYVSRRSPDWIKLKCSQRQEFIIGGWTDPKGSRVGFGALLLGVHDAEGRLIYAGKVGAGFDGARLSDIHRKLKSLASDETPFHGGTGGERRAHWVRPQLLAEVSFAEWTQDGHIRHAVFHALRGDKAPRAIVREAPAHLLGPDVEEAGSGVLSQVRVTHPERVIDPSTGITKLDVLRHYSLVGALMMEHLKGRPVSLVRAPDGIAGQLFFQKHLEKGKMEGVRRLDPSLDRDHVALLEVASPLGLLSAAQMNVIEFHTWNAVKTAIDKPDRITFDLDPGEGVKWAAMQEAARLVKGMLDGLGLASFLKTSGGKGLHVVTPIRRQYDWDTVKDFSKTVVEHMAQTLPDQFVAKSGPKNRVGRIFIDYLRNGFGATTACAWSARARPGLGVSVPVGWDELPRLTGGDQWTLRSVGERIATGNGPWSEYRESARALGAAMKKLGFDRG